MSITRVKDVPETDDFTFRTKSSLADIEVTRAYGELALHIENQWFLPADLRQAAKLFLRLADDLEVEAVE